MDKKNEDGISVSSCLSTQKLYGTTGRGLFLSKKRWFILVAVCIFGVSLAIQDTAPILDEFMQLLELDVETFLFLDTFLSNYMIAIFSVPSGLFLDSFGLRASMHVAVVCFVLANVSTTLLYFTELPGWHHYKMYFYVISQLLKSLCFALFFMLPLKVSESWFSASERTVAWMIMGTSMQVGGCIASLAWPRLITTVADFKILVSVLIGGVILTLITCLALVTRSEPATPPSARAAAKKYSPIVPSLKRMFKRSDILLHTIHQSITASVCLTYNVVLTDILASIGLSQVFSGDYMLVNGLTGILLSLIMMKFVNKVGNPLKACKIGSLCQAAQFVALLTAVMHSASGSVLLGLSLLGILIATWNGPFFNEMTANLITGIVSEPTIISFQLVSVPILLSIVRAIFAHLIEKRENQNDYHNSLLFLIGLCIINEVYYQVSFHGKKSDGESETNEDEPVATGRAQA